jgi:hypothetical protein
MTLNARHAVEYGAKSRRRIFILEKLVSARIKLLLLKW